MKRWIDALLFSLLTVTASHAAEPSDNLTFEQQVRLIEAKTLNDRAQTLVAQDRMHEAIPLAKKALEFSQEVLGKKHPATLPMLTNVALWLESTGDYAGARAYYEQLLAVVTATLGEKHRHAATVADGLGFILQKLGDPAAALPYHEQALAIRREILSEKHPDAATSLNNLGVVLETTGDYAKARTCYEEALAIRKESLGLKDPLTAMSLNNLGAWYQTTGDFAAARAHYEQALAIFLEIHGERHPETALLLNNLGFVLYSLGDFTSARPYYDRALKIRLEVLGEQHPDTAQSLNNLGALLEAMNELAAAKPYYERALEICLEVNGEEHPDTSLLLNNLGSLLDSMGDYAAARSYYDRALAVDKAVLGERHPAIATTLNNLGFLLLAMKDYAAAQPYFEQALAISKEGLGEQHPETGQSYGNLAGLQAASGQWDEAAENTDQARRILRRHVARVLPSLSGREQATFLLAKYAGPFHGALSLGLLRRDDSRLVSLSAGWLLNGKAVAQEALAQGALLAAQARVPEAAELVKELLGLRGQLAALSLSLPAPGQEAARRTQLEQWERQEEMLARRIAQANGQAYRADPWVEVADVQRALAADAVLVDIARVTVFNFQAQGREEKWQPARYVAWVIPPEGRQATVRIIDLGEADQVERAAQEVQTALRAALGKSGEISQQGEPEAEKGLHEPLARLAKLVLEPILAQTGDAKQLILSPDAALWLVPWGALPLADGRYALEQYPIRYVVSGRDLVAQQTGKLARGRPVIMADPDYDLSPQPAQTAVPAGLHEAGTAGGQQPLALDPRTSSSALPKATRLPYTAAEAQAIMPKLQTYADEEPALYIGKEAAENAFKALDRPRVLVLATHGFFLEDQRAKYDEQMWASAEARSLALTIGGEPIENPLLSCGLLFAGCNQSSKAQAVGAEDGMLTGMEVVGTDLRGTELVVLSACETGLGQVHNGEGVAGLRQAFQLAGAKAVVATLWQVSDRESARLMTSFFDNLAAGETKADALRNAQLRMIESRREKYGAAHPFYWAAFTITGE